MSTLQLWLSAIRTFIALLFLLYSAWSDHKTREVSNTVWMVFAPLAFVLTFVEVYLYEPSLFMFFGLSFGLTTVFSIILFYSGGFGGADAKALMCIALALPFYPTDLLNPMLGEASPISKMLFPITVFSNAVLFAVATAVYMFFRNIFTHFRSGEKIFDGGQEKESLGKKILVLFTGYKMPIEKLKEKWHLYPLEDIEETPERTFKRKLVVIPKDETRGAMVERLDTAVKTGVIKNRILVTPGLPMLIFVTAGLIFGLIFGDVVWVFVKLLLR